MGKESLKLLLFSPNQIWTCVNVSGIQQLTLGLLIGTNANSLGQYHSYISCSHFQRMLPILGKKGSNYKGTVHPLPDSQEVLNTVNSGILNCFLVYSIPSCRNLCQILEATKVFYKK